MTVAETLTVADLAESLLEVLERVRGGERFTIESEGEVIATIIPPSTAPTLTWGEFLATYHELPRPDDRFADDLEAIQAEQGLMPEPPEWPD
jgi:antitoxin (DNA-binding transcriptional repressor) of toxin-antitoxin stability system